jgi:hypothetical protein
LVDFGMVVITVSLGFGYLAVRELWVWWLKEEVVVIELLWWSR